jgi:hypothetical protein
MAGLLPVDTGRHPSNPSQGAHGGGEQPALPDRALRLAARVASSVIETPSVPPSLDATGSATGFWARRRGLGEGMGWRGGKRERWTFGRGRGRAIGKKQQEAKGHI